MIPEEASIQLRFDSQSVASSTAAMFAAGGPSHEEQTMLFPLGQIVITRNALDTLPPDAVQGDWGELCEEDRLANDEALKDGTRILSAYTAGQTKFWIITEADRSATTVLLPEDY